MWVVYLYTSHDLLSFPNAAMHPFQDVVKALLQSHRGLIRLLPALPPDWPCGEVRGLMARGAVQVDIAWEEGRLTRAVLRPAKDGVLHLCTPLPVRVWMEDKEIPTEQTAWGFTFASMAGRRNIRL